MSANRLGLFKRSIGAVALTLAFTPLLHGCAAHQPSSERPSENADAFATRVSSRILDALVETNGVPGMGAAVWRGGRLVWTGSAGHRDLELRQPVDENTIFRLASVSKLFAATAAAKLREQGSLDVEAPVQSIVPYLWDGWPPMTTAQLAAHTSGIPHYQAMDADRGGRRFETVREAVAVFAHRDLLFEPQTDYSYSSYGYTLLTAVIEEISGRPYLDYLSQEILSDLKIGPDATATGDPNASKAYEFENGVVREAAPHDYSYGWGSAGLGANAADLARFGGLVMEGEIVSQEALDWMLAPARLADESAVVDEDQTPGGTATTVGFGWRSARDARGERIAHHAGVTNGARSALVLYPDRRLAISLLSNARWVSAIEQTAIMLAAPFMPAQPATPVTCPTEVVAYEGQYDGAAVSGAAGVTLEDGVCTAVITVQNAFGEWLNSYPQRDAEIVKIISVDASGGFSRAALVTPIGVYDLQAEDRGSRYVAALGGSRSLSISFRRP
ncbi:MAG: serine hydrolase domain-containing protein [Gemmatimonadota bacterium]